MILGDEQKRDIARRVENWARWYYGGGTAMVDDAASPFPAYNLVNISSTRDELGAPMPVLAGEAEDTDKILRKMEPEFTKALTVHVLTKGSEKVRAYRCRCKVRTYFWRVARAQVVFIRLVYPRQYQDSIKQIDAHR